jgi:hypothetical protein
MFCTWLLHLSYTLRMEAIGLLKIVICTKLLGIPSQKRCSLHVQRYENLKTIILGICNKVTFIMLELVGAV